MPLTGAFFQLDAASRGLPAAAWDRQLASFAAAGMDTAIVQAVAAGPLDFTPAVEHLLAAAVAHGVGVWLGLPYREVGWYERAWWPPFLRRFAADAMGDAAALTRGLSGRPGCVGLYLPYETNALAPPRAMGAFYGRLVDAVRETGCALPIMISPFHHLGARLPPALPSGALARWWDVALAHARVDVLAWQDGVGVRPALLGRVARDLAALAPVCAAHGVRLWANVEAFERAPAGAVAAAPARFARQLAVVTPHVERVVAFDFNHYLDPAIKGARQP